MNRLLLFLSLFFSINAVAADYVIIAPANNQNIKIKVNQSGTATDVLTVDAAGGRGCSPSLDSAAGATGSLGLAGTAGVAGSLAITYNYWA